MKKTTWLIALLLLILTACGVRQQTPPSAPAQSAPEPEIAAPTLPETPEPVPEEAPEPVPEEAPEIQETEDEPMLKIEIGDRVLYAVFEDNASAKALKEKLAAEPLTLDMHDYGGFEKVGELPWTLPRCDESITTRPGDVILYLGNELTIYYDTNTWSFTRVARIGDTDGDSMRAILGEGGVTAVFSLE